MRVQLSSAMVKRCVSTRRGKAGVFAIVVIVFVILVIALPRSSPYEDIRFYDITLRPAGAGPLALPPGTSQRGRPQSSSSSSDAAAAAAAANGTGGSQGHPYHPFRRVHDKDVFLYSAIANEREPEPGELNIIITAFDSTGTDDLTCCVVMQNEGKLYTSPARAFYTHFIEERLGPVLELFKNAPTKAKQYACVVPQIGLKVTHVTLMTTVCPVEEDEYLPIIYPTVVPQGLALCAKVVFGDKLDPVKLVEWLEVQRLLGVDHVQLMDLHSPPPVAAVLSHYSRLGLLTALPYHLPGRPYGRGLDFDHWVPQQASHDETFPILECRQRLQGYTFVMGHDMDEVLMPSARYTGIKHLLRQQMMDRPDAAGFYFYTQFFLYNWEPVNMDSEVTYFRYLDSTLPRNECKKYIYVTSRVQQARTHAFTPRGPYTSYFVPKEDAVLHHYRKCPQVWATCDEPRMTDRSMLRFREVLEQRVKEAKIAIGLQQ